MNDLRILRERVINAEDSLDRSAGFEVFASGAAIVKTTTITTYPTTAIAFYRVVEQVVTGSEAEGATPTVTDASGAQAFTALNVGTQIPPNNTALVVHQAGGRWVFRYDG
jgi:hypothetical protein